MEKIIGYQVKRDDIDIDDIDLDFDTDYGMSIVESNNLTTSIESLSLTISNSILALEELSQSYSDIVSLESIVSMEVIYENGVPVPKKNISEVEKEKLAQLQESAKSQAKELYQSLVDKGEKAKEKLGIQNNTSPYKPDAFTKIIDKVYLAILTVFDILYEMFIRFFKWVKDEYSDNSRKTSMVTSAIRYIIKNSQKEEFQIIFKPKEKEYLTIDGVFSIKETISLFTTLFNLYITNTNIVKNVNNCLKYNPSKKEYISFVMDPIFPIIEKKKVGEYIYSVKGPSLPKGYYLSANILENNDIATLDSEKLTTLLNLCDATIEETRDNKTVDKENHVLSLTKDELLELNNTQLSFSRQCHSVTLFTDKLIGMLSRLRRQYRNVNYKGSSQFDYQVIAHMTTNLSIINYISRNIKEPFFQIAKMGSFTDNLLLSKLADFSKKEIKELKK